MLIQTTWDAWTAIFAGFWSILDVFFNTITNIFANIFDAVPSTALPFLIGLFCYALIDFLAFLVFMQGGGFKGALMRALMVVTSILTILFALWRLGIIEDLEFEFTVGTVSEVFVSIVYITFGIILAYTIYSDKGQMIRTCLQVLLWGLLLLVTFVTAPVFEGFMPDFDTVTQIMVCAIIFGIPKILNSYDQQRNEAENDERKA